MKDLTPVLFDPGFPCTTRFLLSDQLIEARRQQMQSIPYRRLSGLFRVIQDAVLIPSDEALQG